jgi:hypothetical protein
MGDKVSSGRHPVRAVGPTTPGSLVAPECLAADVVDGEIVLLLEHVEGTPAEDWSIAAYGTAAEALGRWQAPYLTGMQYPDFSWLSLRFLREYSSEKPADWGLLDDDDAWDLPLVRDSGAALLVNAERAQEALALAKDLGL